MATTPSYYWAVGQSGSSRYHLVTIALTGKGQQKTLCGRRVVQAARWPDGYPLDDSACPHCCDIYEGMLAELQEISEQR